MKREVLIDASRLEEDIGRSSVLAMHPTFLLTPSYSAKEAVGMEFL